MIHFTRRKFLVSTATALGASVLPSIALSTGRGDSPSTKGVAARYHRHDVTSPEGQRMLASYARGIRAMLALPADHPQNWFRNAFIHFLDCPHGNWWFYVWHRGYVGYFEQTIRKLSGDADFAMPYWDWTRLPQIPQGMFDGVLNPTDAAYAPYTGNLARFTDFIKPSLQAYWNTLSSLQRTQLQQRGYSTFDQAWDDVTGFSPAQNAGISGNAAYVITCGARYLSRDNPHLDPKTTYDCSPYVISAGLMPTEFYDADINRSFTSSRTASHTVQPNGATQFSILEGLPHNKVHNCIGGVGAVDPGPYGNMTNFLSPVDPVFFLHHANMDRLWDVWTRKQIARGLPILPTGADLQALASEPFLFYVDGNGQFVGPSKAGQYLSMARFDYDYVSPPGLAEAVSGASTPPSAKAVQATVSGNKAAVELPSALLRDRLASPQATPLVAAITLPRPEGLSNTREFDVLVNAPDDVAQVNADSPYYAGTIAFFGPVMPGMKMSHDATFAVPLRPQLQAFKQLGATSTRLEIRVVPSSGQRAHATAVSAVSILGS